jgi:hypothetical protein
MPHATAASFADHRRLGAMLARVIRDFVKAGARDDSS